MRVKMLLTYNILPQHHEDYMRLMVQDLMPALQKLGLENVGVWHTAYGDYPLRLIVFVAEESALDQALKSNTWNDLETQLKNYTTDYTRRIVEYAPGFQF